MARPSSLPTSQRADARIDLGRARQRRLGRGVYAGEPEIRRDKILYPAGGGRRLLRVGGVRCGPNRGKCDGESPECREDKATLLSQLSFSVLGWVRCGSIAAGLPGTP